jgi:hypothetical protein
MHLVATSGKSYTILDTKERYVFTLAPNLAENWKDVTIRGARPAETLSIESAYFDETYTLTLCTLGEPFHLAYLYSITMFALLRYRQEYLEARGFGEVSVGASGPTVGMSEEGQIFYVRSIQLSGVVKNSWPKLRTQRVQGVITVLAPIGSGDMFTPTDASNQTWIGDEDWADLEPYDG